MKLNYNFSYIYHKNLNKHNPASVNWGKIKVHGKKFVSKYENTIEEILNIIPKITGVGWKKNEMEVYFVSWKGPSFSKPLTLKVRKDMLLMLTILTHELLHNALDNKKPGIKLEKEINNYVVKIFDKLNIDIDEQIKQMKEFSEINNNVLKPNYKTR